MEVIISLAPQDRLAPQAERDLKTVYNTLSEKDRRRLAAMEACTRGGLVTTAEVMDQEYHSSGKTSPTDLLERMPIQHDKKLADYNYVIAPH